MVPQKPISQQLIYEGKAKRIFKTDQEDQVLVEFKNDTTAFNSLKREELEGKGAINCQISVHLFELLEANQIPTHFLYQAGDARMVAKLAKIIPLEVVIRNIATGSLCKQTPIAQGTQLEPPLLDLYYKDDELADPLLTEARLERLKLVSANQRFEIERLARQINDLLKSFFEQIDLVLVDFKLEFGLGPEGEILVADEISPDTCRIWDKRNQDPKAKILDKDRFREDLGGVVRAYGEILKRIQGPSSNPGNCS